MAHTEFSMIIGTIPRWHGGVSPTHVLLVMANGRPHLSLRGIYGTSDPERVWIYYPDQECDVLSIMLHALVFKSEKVRAKLEGLLSHAADSDKHNPLEISEVVSAEDIAELVSLCRATPIEAGVLIAEAADSDRGREI